MSQRGYISRDDQRLSYVEFGNTDIEDISRGGRPSVLLIHDVLGRATSWARTAEWLTPRYRAVGHDLRGHGWSAPPADGDLIEQLVTDAAAVVEGLGLGPATIVGNGAGALVGWTLAARRPDLVRALVLADHGIDTYSATPTLYEGWFEQWPLPFGTLSEVDDYFTSAKWPLRTPFFRESFHEAEDGYRPLFEFDHVLRTMAGWDDPRHWDSLAEVRCPALVVRGAAGTLPADELRTVAERLPLGRYVEVEGAGHLLHFDQPERWRAVVEPFLDEVAGLPAGTE